MAGKKSNEQYVPNMQDDVERLGKEHEQLLENAPDAIVEVDKNGTFTYLNSRALEVLGYRKEELVGKSFTVLALPERVMLEVRAFDKVIGGEKLRGYRTVVLSKDGKRIWVEIEAKPRIEDKKITGAIAIIHNISDEMMKRGDYHAYFEGVLEPIIVLDENGKVKEVNHVAEELFGVSKENLVGQSIRELEFFSDKKLLEEMLEEAMRGETIKVQDVELLLKDGSKIDLNIDCAPIIRGEKKEGAVCLLTNVTELVEREHEMEEELKAVKEREKQRQDFLHVVTHELKTPLTPIKGYLELLLDGHFGTLNPRQKESLEIIAKSLKISEDLIGDLSQLAKMESGRFSFSMKAENIGEVMNDSLNEMKGFAIEKKINVSANIQPNMPTVEMDRAAITRVINNLMHNATKYTPEYGKVWAEVRKVNGDVEISVHDSGIGIAQKDIPHLFTKFFRVKETAAEFMGTGLGLSICKSVVDAHNGRIWATSQLGKGSVFYFTLPIKQPAKTAASEVV